MEGKSNKQGIRFKDDQLIWGNLTCDLLIDWDNPYHQHGLKSSIKHCRVIRREQKGKTKWFMQLVCKGLPYANPDHPVSNGTVGIDLNISNLAVVGDDYAALLPFTEGVKPIAKRISALQRKMSRSERIANPDNFEPDFEAV
jgi:hypothetical protein